jgi:hypothetical protein
VGSSGMGKGHGRAAFETFSSARAVMKQVTRFSMIGLIYPPYNRLKERMIDLTLRFF